ncbi:MAG TPA: hypothetical protein VFM05_08670 [Candidatus Saccharimonadales bacterium]|nr:hypothetical protein [Candidatus Saccharimonadales bacterium]
MRRKELIIANLLLAAMILGFGWLAFKLSVNQSPLETGRTKSVSDIEEKEKTQVCSKKAPLKIGATDDQHLKRLDDYQKMCVSFVTDTLMIFTAFSGDSQAATADATAMAAKLKKFDRAGVTPLVIVEPYVNDAAMSYKAYLAGSYDQGMDRYFQLLKEAGVTDAMMGTWVPFPESNTPSWNNKDTEPRDFALCVNKYLTKLKQYFPGAKGSVLLNATTYEPNDLNWENGDYISLVPYADGLDKNLVTSFGIQGFPWMTHAQQRKRTIFDVKEFLQTDLAIGAAQVLRTKDVWINSGTFASKYTDDPAKTVHLSINERKAILNGILQAAIGVREYQQNEYRVSINLFSEDKSDANEATDWSYSQDIESQGVLKEFLIRASEAEIPVSLYDKAKWQLN